MDSLKTNVWDDVDNQLTDLIRNALFWIHLATRQDCKLVKLLLDNERTYQIRIGNIQIGRYYPDKNLIFLYDSPDNINSRFEKIVLGILVVYSFRLLYYGGCGPLAYQYSSDYSTL